MFKQSNEELQKIAADYLNGVSPLNKRGEGFDFMSMVMGCDRISDLKPILGDIYQPACSKALNELDAKLKNSWKDYYN